MIARTRHLHGAIVTFTIITVMIVRTLAQAPVTVISSPTSESPIEEPMTTIGDNPVDLMPVNNNNEPYSYSDPSSQQTDMTLGALVAIVAPLTGLLVISGLIIWIVYAKIGKKEEEEIIT